MDKFDLEGYSKEEDTKASGIVCVILLLCAVLVSVAIYLDKDCKEKKKGRSEICKELDTFSNVPPELKFHYSCYDK